MVGFIKLYGNCIYHCAGKRDGGKPQPAEGGMGLTPPAPKGRAEQPSLGEAEARLFS